MFNIIYCFTVELLRNYLTGRKQQIKLQADLSSWAEIQKVVPLGSILGPLLLNIFINDIFYFIEYGTLYNNGDDNTLSYLNDNYETLFRSSILPVSKRRIQSPGIM